MSRYGDRDEWCFQCERWHGPMDYGDGCLTDPIIAEDNAQLGRFLAGAMGRRCLARLEQSDAGADGYFGRCELRRHPAHVDHALERGMYWVRWRGDDAAVSGTWVTT